MNSVRYFMLSAFVLLAPNMSPWLANIGGACCLVAALIHAWAKSE